MVATAMNADQARHDQREFSKLAKTKFFDIAPFAANDEITLPFYLDTRFPSPVISITQIEETPETTSYNLYNVGGTSDQVVTTGVLANYPGAGQFQVGNQAGANPGNIIMLGTGITLDGVIGINAIWRDDDHE
jgi:hypothetical protein